MRTKSDEQVRALADRFEVAEFPEMLEMLSDMTGDDAFAVAEEFRRRRTVARVLEARYRRLGEELLGDEEKGS